MQIVASILIVLIALEHVWFMVLEMALWNTPYGRRTFGTTLEQAATTAALAANQGLYNGFLAAGLFLALFYPDPIAARAFATFFITCVMVAGVYGAWSVNRRIAVIQALPAAIAFVAVSLAPRIGFY